MGSALNALCTPAGQCICCPVEVGVNDWYYDPSTPNVIKKQQSDVLVTHVLADGETLDNEATGLSYRYDAVKGLITTGFMWPNRTYIILGEISGEVVVPVNCTLIFEGGRFTGSLVGNITTIEAGTIQIFDVGISLSGTFTNEHAYPEWWGAISTRDTVSPPNCRAAIQAAFDSIFGEIRFCPGYYYVGNAVERIDHELALLYLNDTKVIRMSGNSHNKNKMTNDGATSVIWSDNDCNLLLINILADYPQSPYSRNEDKEILGRTMIIGGEFNMSECSGFQHTAILVYTKDLMGLRIETSLCGPIGYIDRNESGGINWPNGIMPTESMLNNGYMGYGIKFTHNPALLDSSGNLISDQRIGVCYLTNVDCNINGFGHGFTVDYSTQAGDMTSMELYGFIDNCLRYIYAPSRAFNGGVVECVIQTRTQNAADGFTEPIIQGNFTEAYLNPRIWDLSPAIDVLRLSPNSLKVRLGQRLIGVMMTRFRSYGFGEVLSTPTREEGVRSLAVITSADSSSSLGAFGNFDLLDLSTVKGLIQTANYVHMIDNDLLSIDSVVSGVSINIQQEGFITKYPEYGGIHKPNTSPFDRSGIVFAFNNSEYNKSASITVTISFPSSCWYPLQFLAMHLKGSKYNYFTTMKVKLTCSNDSPMTLFEGSYADIERDDNRSDIILPFIFKDNQNPEPKVLEIKFTGFNYRSGIWKPGGDHEDFKFSIEGRFCRHLWHNVFSAGGGAMGRPLTKFGKLFISGTETYANISALPNDAASGALATIGDGNVLTNYPVMKTNQGWMIQGLVGTSQSLLALTSSLGTLAIGQQAYDTTLGLPLWWNGSGWIDATGTERYH